MENKLYRCPYSKTDSVACDMQSPCIECKVYFPDTMDKIFTSHNTASAPLPACITCAVPNCGMKAGYCGLYKPQ